MALKEEIEKYWKKVDAGFDKIVESGVLPVGNEADGTLVTKESLRAELDGLRKGVYTIAVCGGVKAGKSTLLNSLIFGDSVLPAFDTPMTAKLTFIRHAKGAPKFEAEFYDKDEWKQIFDSYSEEERKALSDRLEVCARKGVQKNSYICSPRREPIVGYQLKEELPSVISDPMNGLGKYTPFIKSVTISIDHPALEGLQIVDTPGLNDANEINSRETAKWVREAHAVVYVLETRGASASDVEFFQSYFPSTASEARVFVQNKIDSDPNYASAKSAIRKYGQEEKYKDLGLFG
ncbi:MAG: dynamin family protein, partial [Duodenibacillus sp.]